jgi:TetR/AcrR family transcriptional repressor of mexJK operon
VGEVANSAVSGQTPSRGRLDKRQAIVEAAFRVFAREGYAGASVDAIAAEAGVAKPTIYNHMGGKENLFRQVLTQAAAQAIGKNVAAIERMQTRPADLAAELVEVALELARCYCRDESGTFWRLMNAEIIRFPDLWDEVWGSGPDRLREAMAGRLARLAMAGYLTIKDPEMAADQFLALTTHDLERRTALGTRLPSDDELREIVAPGVETFIRAFAPAEPGERARNHPDPARIARPRGRRSKLA